jgi:pyruvate dehydrogenase E1 component alpha subunit
MRTSYRYHGHSMSDPGVSYRSKDEVQDVRATRDPIEKLRRSLLDSGLCEADELRAIERAERERIDRAVTFAKNSPEPEVGKLKRDIYTDEELYPLPRGCDIKDDPIM